jgi:sugar phosphate isomerase/epimerase
MPALLSIQLYTLREQAGNGLAPLIRRLGEIGYAGVEPAGLHDLTPVEFRRYVEEAGMTVSSGHIPLLSTENAAEVLDAQQAMGNDTVVVAFLPPDQFEDEAAIARTAESLNAANEMARARGMTMGYHNHYWEFSNRVGDRSAHAALFQQLDNTVIAEIDTYWAQVGGADPVQVVSELGPRAQLLHIKDGPADDPASDMTAVGDGVIDVAGIAAVSRAAWHVVELDRCATDMLQAVEKSHRFLTEGGFAVGRS